MEYLVHITTELDRWDLLADFYYGNALRYGEITAANPTVPKTQSLPAGLQLIIPIVDEAPALSSSPWTA